MKTKKFRNKLTLNKKTIADLTISKMKSVYGGILQSEKTDCTSCYATGCGCTFTCETCITGDAPPGACRICLL